MDDQPDDLVQLTLAYADLQRHMDEEVGGKWPGVQAGNHRTNGV